MYTLCSETNTIYIYIYILYFILYIIYIYYIIYINYIYIYIYILYIHSDIYYVIYCLIYHVISHGFPMLAANTLAARPWASESWPRPLQIRWSDHILSIHRYQPKDLMLGGFHKFDINGGTPKWMVYNGKIRSWKLGGDEWEFQGPKMEIR